MFRRHTKIIELTWFDDDVLPLAVLVAFDDLVLLHDRSGLFAAALDGAVEHFLVTNSFAGAATDLMEGDLVLCLGSGVKTDTEGHERNSNLTRPVRTRHAT